MRLKNHLYIVQCDRYYKIGISSSADKRLNGMKTSTPFEMKLLVCYVLDRVKPGYSGGKECRKVEKYLHTKFRSKRIRGEWFELSKEDLNQIPSLIKQAMNNIETPNPKIIHINQMEIKEP